MTERTALIVGAGIGGLAAGVALRRAGWRVRIFERAAETRALGFALSLAPNAIEALRELGLAERLMSEGFVVGPVEIRRADGRVLKRFDVAAALAHAASVFALRPALHGALLDATQSESLTLGCEASAFEADGAGVVLNFKDGRAETGTSSSVRMASAPSCADCSIRTSRRPGAAAISASAAWRATCPAGSEVSPQSRTWVTASRPRPCAQARTPSTGMCPCLRKTSPG
jgi:hypothetical protein